MIHSTIKILYQNENFLIIDKPAGVSTHNESPSVLDYLRNNGLPDHFVNRLDTETSGLLVIAMTKHIHEPLRISLNKGLKKYLAVLRGSIDLQSLEKKVWNWSISDKAEGRKNPQGQKKDQVLAVTEVRLVTKNKYLSLVELILKSGRQHQIRKHSALAKHPVIGDKRYNDDKYNQMIFERYKIKRMFLHAFELQFEFQGENFNFKTEDLSWDKLIIT